MRGPTTRRIENILSLFFFVALTAPPPAPDLFNDTTMTTTTAKRRRFFSRRCTRSTARSPRSVERHLNGDQGKGYPAFVFSLHIREPFLHILWIKPAVYIAYTGE